MELKSRIMNLMNLVNKRHWPNLAQKVTPQKKLTLSFKHGQQKKSFVSILCRKVKRFPQAVDLPCVRVCGDVTVDRAVNFLVSAQ